MKRKERKRKTQGEIDKKCGAVTRVAQFHAAVVDVVAEQTLKRKPICIPTSFYLLCAYHLTESSQESNDIGTPVTNYFWLKKLKLRVFGTKVI